MIQGLEAMPLGPLPLLNSAFRWVGFVLRVLGGSPISFRLTSCPVQASELFKQMLACRDLSRNLLASLQTNQNGQGFSVFYFGDWQTVANVFLEWQSSVVEAETSK